MEIVRAERGVIASTNHVIVWVDPGLWTGLAAWYPETRICQSTELEFAGAGAALSMLSPGQNTWIGWEKFTITAATARMTQYEPHALEVIGMARWLAIERNWRILPAQLPAERKMITPEKLKRIGMHPGKQRDDDALSATQHLVVYLLKSRLLPADMVAEL